MNKLIEALLVEREGYVRRNLPDRVKLIDAELAKLGAKPLEAATVEPEAERAVPAKARKKKP